MARPAHPGQAVGDGAYFSCLNIFSKYYDFVIVNDGNVRSSVCIYKKEAPDLSQYSVMPMETRHFLRDFVHEFSDFSPKGPQPGALTLWIPAERKQSWQVRRSDGLQVP